jgi:hypothetical protein
MSDYYQITDLKYKVMNLECLKTLIGLTQNENECFEGEFQIPNYNKSDSGLYLDKLEAAPSLQAIKSIAGTSKVGGLMNDALQSAIIELNNDFIVAVNSNFQTKTKPFVGNIGDSSFARTLKLDKNIVGLKLRTDFIPGTYIKINKIFVAMDTSAMFDIIIYKHYRDTSNLPELVKIINVESEANKSSKKDLTSESIELPLFDETQSSIDYYFVYDRSNGMNPKDNKISCNCGNKDRTINQYFTLTGVQGSDILDIKKFTNSQFANGLIIDIDVRCSIRDLTCKVINESESLKTVMATTLRFKAGELLIEKLLNSSEINRNTMSDREHWYGKRNHFRKEYWDRITWMTYQENLDTDLLDCHVCKNGIMFKSGILS